MPSVTPVLDASTFNHLQSDPALVDEAHGHPQCYSIGTPRWACVYTHPQAELWANTNLQTIGYTTYLPMQAVQRRDRATPTVLHQVETPLFARYLFLQFNHQAESWSPIRAAPGVIDIIRHGQEVHYARDGDISALQATDELRRHLPAPNAQWAPGTPCSLANGLPLSGLPAVVTELRGHQVHVAIMFLGQLRHIRVHASQLIPREA